jgi:hypothetical protein
LSDLLRSDPADAFSKALDCKRANLADSHPRPLRESIRLHLESQRESPALGSWLASATAITVPECSWNTLRCRTGYPAGTLGP